MRITKSGWVPAVPTRVEPKDTWLYKELGLFDLAPLVEMAETVKWRAEYRNPHSIGCLRVYIPWLIPKHQELLRKLHRPHGLALRCDIRKIPPENEITPHRDTHVKTEERRLHWPIISHPDIKMVWPDHGVEVHLKPGTLYEVNPREVHAVINPTSVTRVHLMIDVLNLETAQSGNEEKQNGSST